jgi:hypothetical protein
VKEQVNQFLATLKDEEVEVKALAAGAAANAADPDHAEDELQEVRKPPSQHSEGSEKYWKAVGNRTVRTYCSLHVQPKTLDGIISLVSQSGLKDFQGEGGVSCVLTHLDLDALGESMGPGQRPLLRKRFVPDQSALRILLHGSMIARNGQRKGDECMVPSEGELVFVHQQRSRSLVPTGCGQKGSSHRSGNERCSPGLF